MFQQQIVDATVLTEAGYVGEDVENILLRLLQKSEMNVELAQKGIIYIDEIDKNCQKKRKIHQLLEMFLVKEYNKHY